MIVQAARASTSPCGAVDPRRRAGPARRGDREPVVIDDVAQAEEPAPISAAGGDLRARGAAAGRGQVDRRRCTSARCSAARFTDDRREPAAARGRPRGARRSSARGSTSASTGSPQELQRACCPSGCRSCRACGRGALLAGGRGGPGRRRLVRRVPCPAGGCCSSIGDVAGRGVDRRVDDGPAAQRAARVRPRRTRAGRVARAAERVPDRPAPRTRMTTVVLLVARPGDRGAALRQRRATRRRCWSTGTASRAVLDGAPAPARARSTTPVYTEATAELGPGRPLVLYTDGLVELRGAYARRGVRAAARGARRRRPRAGGAVRGDPRRRARRGDVVGRRDVRRGQRPVTLGSSVALALPGEAAGLASLRTMLRRWLVEQDAGEPEVHAVTMATNEAVQNAIEHAHGLSRAPFEVRARARRRRRRGQRARPRALARGLRATTAGGGCRSCAPSWTRSRSTRCRTARRCGCAAEL